MGRHIGSRLELCLRGLAKAETDEAEGEEEDDSQEEVARIDLFNRFPPLFFPRSTQINSASASSNCGLRNIRLSTPAANGSSAENRMTSRYPPAMSKAAPKTIGPIADPATLMATITPKDAARNRPEEISGFAAPDAQAEQ